MKRKKYIKEINKYSEKLNEVNRLKFDRIVLRIRFAHVDQKEAEEFLYHCLDVFLDAQQQDIPVESMLGCNDIDLFCEEFIYETRKYYSLSKRIFWELQTVPITMLIFFGLFQLLPSLIQYWIDFGFTPNVRVNTSMISNTIIVLIFTELLFSKASLLYSKFNCKDKKINRKYTLIVFLAIYLLIGIMTINSLYMSRYIFCMNYFIFMGVLGIICIVQSAVEAK